MKFKKIMALVLVGVMALSMAACKKEDKGSGVKKVSLVMWGAEEDQEMLAEMVAKFVELHKDEVKLTVSIGVESEQSVKDTILGDVAGAADIYSFANDQINELVQAGALVEVTDAFGKAEVTARNVAGSIEAATVNGKLYAFPRTADNGFFLFYNKEFLSEEDVASWETMLEKAASLGKKVSMEMNSGWYTFGFYEAVGLSCGLGENGKDTVIDWNSKTNAVTGVQVTQKILDICKHPGFIATEDAEFVTGIAEWEDEDQTTSSGAGQIIAGVNGTWNAAKAQLAWGDNYAATKLPTFDIDGEDYQMYSVAGYKMIGVNPNCKNAGWALKLAEFITNEENQVKSFEERQTGPSNIKAAESDAVKANVAIAAFAKQQQWAAVQIVGTNFWTATESFGQVLQNGNPDNIDLQKLLDDMVAAATAHIE